MTEAVVPPYTLQPQVNGPTSWRWSHLSGFEEILTVPDSTDPLVLRFLANPSREIEQAYAQSEDFLLSYLEHCMNRLDSDPADGRRLTLIAKRVITPKIEHSPCITVQIWALLSASARFLGRLDLSDGLLEIAFDLADDCLKCRAHLFRRRALIRRNQRRFDEAIADSNASIKIYLGNETDNLHELYGNGPATAFLWRGTVYYSASKTVGQDRKSLLSLSIDDIGRALSLLTPHEFSKLYRIAVFNLACALSDTGKAEDLLIADQYLRMARSLFRGVTYSSQERASLDWLTAMIRHELGTMRPARVRFYLARSLNVFVELGMPQETVAVASDLARIAFPDQNRIRSILNGLEDKLCRISDDLRQKIQDVQAATRLQGWDAAETVKAAIEALREACGPKTLPCLIAWPSNS